MNTADHDSFWRLIDAVLVINLDRRPERWEQFQNDADGIVPREKLHRVSAVWGQDVPGYGKRPWFRGRKRDSTWAARAGCTLSHRRALSMAREEGWQTVLILEDDAVFDSCFSGIAPAIGESLERYSSEWDVCYLGFTDPRGPYRRLQELSLGYSLDRLFGAKTTHAYVVKASVRDWLIEFLPEETQVWKWLLYHRIIDRWYERTISRRHKVACVSPSVINQKLGYSDISERAMGERPHSIAVPARSAGGALYPHRLAIERIFSRVQYIYDLLRGSVKRIRGF